MLLPKQEPLSIICSVYSGCVLTLANQFSSWPSTAAAAAAAAAYTWLTPERDTQRSNSCWLLVDPIKLPSCRHPLQVLGKGELLRSLSMPQSCHNSAQQMLRHGHCALVMLLLSFTLLVPGASTMRHEVVFAFGRCYKCMEHVDAKRLLFCRSMLVVSFSMQALSMSITWQC